MRWDYIIAGVAGAVAAHLMRITITCVRGALYIRERARTRGITFSQSCEEVNKIVTLRGPAK